MFDTLAPGKGHMWQLLAWAVMLVAAYFILVCLQEVGEISPLTGLPEYIAQVQKLQVLAALWAGLALVLPFLAAKLLGFSGQSVHRYLGRLLISVLGTVGFTICLRVVGHLLSRL